MIIETKRGPMKMYSLRVPVKLANALERWAMATDRSVNNAFVFACRKALEMDCPQVLAQEESVVEVQ